MTEHGEPSLVKAHMIDGNFLLHCLPPKIPPMFDGLSKAILQTALTYKPSRIDIVFDTYESPSIKDCERERCGTNHQQFVIVGPEQVRPSKLEKALKSMSFKQALPRFLLEDWCKDEYVTIIGDREVFLGVLLYRTVSSGVILLMNFHGTILRLTHAFAFMHMIWSVNLELLWFELVTPKF